MTTTLDTLMKLFLSLFGVSVVIGAFASIIALWHEALNKSLWKIGTIVSYLCVAGATFFILALIIFCLWTVVDAWTT